MTTILRGDDGFDSSWIQQSTSTPTINTNAEVGTVIIDKSSGVLYTCIDSTTNNAIWKGSDGSIIAPTLRLIQNNYLTSGVVPVQDNNIASSWANATGPSNAFSTGQQDTGYYIGWVPAAGYGTQRYCMNFGIVDVTNFNTMYLTTASYSNASGSGAEYWGFGICPTSYGTNTATFTDIASETNHSAQEFSLDISSFTGEYIIWAGVYYEEIRITDFRLEG